LTLGSLEIENPRQRARYAILKVPVKKHRLSTGWDSFTTKQRAQQFPYIFCARSGLRRLR